MLKKSLFFYLSFLLFSSGMNSQEMMKIQNGSLYPATSSWNFICENYAFTGNLEVQVAKSEKGGILKLSVGVSNNTFYLGGTVYLFLEDGSIITCTDKGNRTNNDRATTAFYIFSSSEMNRLRTVSIKNIRFTIMGKQGKFTSQTGHLAAVNRINYFEPYDKLIQNFYTTELEINALYH